MAPRLDLSSTHAKVMVAPPRMKLRRAASYNHQDRAAASLRATSSGFNFNHLLFSPPPSPSLPALVPSPRRRSSQILTARPSWILRRLFYLGALVTTLYLLAFAWGDGVQSASPRSLTDDFEMVAQDTVPEFPTPIVVSDRRQRPRWTVSIPHDYDFPLSINEYAAMSRRCRDVSAHARQLHGKPPLADHDHDKPDNYFVDIDDAERTRLLPPIPRDSHPRHSGHFVGLNWESMAGKPECRSSLTFVMESPDAGLGASLMTMWTLYALAKEQGRGFFVDDSRWAYGAYTDIFQPPPLPDCRPPPRHHMLPCPAQARHLVVSAVTASHVLPTLLAKHGRITGTTASQRGLFELARTGHRDLFALIKEDQGYVHQRIKEIHDKGGEKSRGAPIVGLHIRRGDVHPLEYQYRDNYIPIEVFTRHARRLVEAHHNQSGVEKPQPKPVTVVASDDPAVHGEPDMSDAVLAQQRIRLASKGAVEHAAPDPRVLHRFVEEAQGWDGGFFALMFWNLGGERKKTAAATSVPGDGPNSAKAPSQETLRLRGFIGRAYMMDLAVLAGASDSVVCAVSAMGCRLLGVMMGWERAMDQGAWVNVDGGHGWSGVGW